MIKRERIQQDGASFIVAHALYLPCHRDLLLHLTAAHLTAYLADDIHVADLMAIASTLIDNYLTAQPL